MAIPNFQYGDWRISQRIENPIFAYALDNFLEPAFYTELVRTFPGIENFKRIDVGNKLTLNMHEFCVKQFQYVLATQPAWAEFAERIRHREFIDRFRALGDFGLVNAMKFEFSVLPGSGGFIHVHPDTPNKVSTIVIYMTDTEWPVEWGGGLKFYRHRIEPDRDFIGHKDTSFEEVDTIFHAPFSPNRAVGFVRTKNSLHGVPPLTNPLGTPRRSITINFMR